MQKYPGGRAKSALLLSTSISTLLLSGLLASAAGCSIDRTGDYAVATPTPLPTPTTAPALESQLTVSSTRLEFGSVQSGVLAEQDLELTNTGDTALLLTVSFPVNPDDQFTASSPSGPVPDHIEAGSTLSIRVTYQPSVNGEAPGTLRIDTNDPVSPRFDIALMASGEGIQPDDDHDGYSVADGDCDDLNPNVHPEMLEACDGIDNDCDGAVDEDGQSTFYVDSDGDAHGDPSTAFLACMAGAGAVTIGDDCDDADSYTFPEAAELCDGVDNDCDGVADEDARFTVYLDQDGDGFGDAGAAQQACAVPAGYAAEAGDCDDRAANVYPHAFEACDGVDNDCNGQVDEDGTTLFFEDLDGDGYGDPQTGFEACQPGPNAVAVAGDCDDNSSSTHVDAVELCDGRDNDCDGKIDDGATSIFFQDRDGDGYGDSDSTAIGCTAPAGYVAAGGDCADNDKGIHPGAEESCDQIDNDCDGSVDQGVELTWYEDSDGDGHGNKAAFVSACAAPAGYVADHSDCNDQDATVYTSAIEACDGKDNDCNGEIDEVGQQTWFQDSDGDGYGNRDIHVSACSQPPGFVAAPEGSDGFDCQDSDPSVHPAADEACDGKDNDCNGEIDEVGQQTWFQDSDGDGYGDMGYSLVSCATPPGYVSDSTDCDDHDAQVHPAAPEACDSKDNDCDGLTDEDGVTTFYRDFDQDGHGDPTVTQVGCIVPGSYVAVGDDCNDHDRSVYPAAPEVCDGKDNNCDSQIDEGVQQTWYLDADHDSFGDAVVVVTACSQPAGYSAQAGDCNDRDASVYPDAAESCDSKDNDCDGQADEGVMATWYLDADRDGFGDPGTTVLACAQPPLYVSGAGDCNDLDKTVYPSAPELCDGKDNNCNDGIDEDVQLTFYADADHDGYGDSKTPSYGCSAPRGTVEDATDCDDGRSSVHPEAAELCDGLDNDCDTQIDEGAMTSFYADMDGDGYGVSSISVEACAAPAGFVSSSSDCDDAAIDTYPGAQEFCDGRDNNCNLTVDEGVKLSFSSDVDQDGFGDPESQVQACAVVIGLVTNSIDCDDQDGNSYPGAPELCDSKDNDCDSQIDEAGDATENVYYRDADLDGHGRAAPTLFACSAPSGYAATKDDCDDSDPNTYPRAVEQCQGGDNDCDGVNAPPAAPEASSNGPVCAGGAINLSASGSGAGYSWTGPGGFVSSLQNPVITGASAANAGDYTVTAAIAGCSSTAVVTTVQVITTSAAFTVSNPEPAGSEAVTFSAAQAGATYAWSFPGGTPSTSTEQSPVVTWTDGGSYTVSLTVTQNGCPATSSSTITVTTLSNSSCDTIKAGNPEATDGVYTIDPDGAGPDPAFDVYCDMTTNGGGWTLLYYVDAAHFDGYVANNKVAQNTPVTALNSTSDMFNPPASLVWTETMFACTQQDDSAHYAWTYGKPDPATWFINTTKDYGFPAITDTWTDSPNTARCMSTNKAESGFGFMVLETGTSCGTCQNMLFGNYYYANGGQCNSTDNTYGVHTSPYRAKSVGYPLCNKKQTSNGKFWIGVR